MNPRTRRQRRQARKWTQNRRRFLNHDVPHKQPFHGYGTVVQPRSRWQTLPNDLCYYDLVRHTAPQLFMRHPKAKW